jgi:hypothetical protein
LRKDCKYGEKYWDMFSLPAELIASKKDYNIIMPHNAPDGFLANENYLKFNPNKLRLTKKESYDYSNWREEFKATEYEFFDVITPDTIKSTTKSWIMENLTNIKSRGATYLVSLIWRGQNISMQIFFPQIKRPTKNEVTDEIRKIYPLANVLTFSPIKMDPTKALLYVGDENGPQ